MWTYHIRFVCCHYRLHALWMGHYSGELELLHHGEYSTCTPPRKFSMQVCLHSQKNTDTCSFLSFALKIAQVCKVCFKGAKLWDSVKELSRAYEYVMGLIIFLPIVILSWFPYVSEFQTRLLFNQGFCRGLQISMILAGRKDTYKSDWHTIELLRQSDKYHTSRLFSYHTLKKGILFILLTDSIV